MSGDHSNSPRALAAALASVCLAAVLAGCTTARPLPPTPAAPPEASAEQAAEATFAAFRRDYSGVSGNAAGLFVNASFYFSSPKRSNRTMLEFWGNFGLPLRLDVRAGIGTSLAHFREDDSGLLAFYPDRRAAYAHNDPVQGARILELPLLFSLGEFGRAMAGSISALVPEPFATAARNPDGTFSYGFTGGRIESLVLGPSGRPLALTGRIEPRGSRPGGPWRLEFSDFEEGGAPALAQKITLSLPGEEKGVLRIKTRELKLTPWPAKALDMALPDGTIVYLLDRQAPPS